MNTNDMNMNEVTPDSSRGKFFDFLKEVEHLNWVSQDSNISFFDISKKTDGKYIIIESETEQPFDVNAVHPFTLSKFLVYNFPGYADLNKLRDGKIMLRTRTSKQADQVIGKLLDFYDYGKVKISGVKNLNEVKAVISGKELTHLTDEELLQVLKQHRVTNVRRLTRTEDGKTFQTGVIILTFELQEIPKELKIVNFLYYPRTYYPGPFQCMKCLKYGHTFKTCDAEDELCRLCGNKKLEGHKCGAAICVNCPKEKNQHCPTKGDCPEFLFEKIVQKLKVQKKLSYHQAKKELLKKCEAESRRQHCSLSSQLKKPDDTLIALERQIVAQSNENEKEKQLNESLRKLIAEKAEILKERKKLLEELKKQQEERNNIELEIAKYGGPAMEQTDADFDEESLMNLDDFSEPEERANDEVIVNTQGKNKKRRKYSNNTPIPNDLAPLTVKQLSELIKKEPELSKNIEMVESQNEGSKLNWYFWNGSLMHSNMTFPPNN